MSFKASAGWTGKKPIGKPPKFTRPIASASGQGAVLTLIRVSKHAKAKGPK